MKTIDASSYIDRVRYGTCRVVGTFPGHKPGTFKAYTRIYNPEWPGCVKYEVLNAASGSDAKRAAVKARTEEEAKGSQK